MTIDRLTYTDFGQTSVDKINNAFGVVDALGTQLSQENGNVAALNVAAAAAAANIQALQTGLSQENSNVAALNVAVPQISAQVAALETTVSDLPDTLTATVALINGSSLIRPGDAPKLFCSSLAGGDPSQLPANFQGVIVSAEGGAALRVSNASLVACRELDAIESGRTYKIRGVFRRRTDTPDPAGDAIQFGLAWYDQSKILISTTTLTLDITVVMGRQEMTALVGGASSVGASGTFSAGDTIAPPAAACYARRFVQFYGTSHVTDVQVLSWLDVTESGLISPNVDAVAARVGALESYDLPARIDLFASEIESPISMRVSSFGQAQATTVPSFVEILSTVGYAQAGVGAASYARSSSLMPGGFASVDGAFWSLSETRKTFAMFGGDPTGTSDNAAVLTSLPAGLTVHVDPGTYLVGSAATTAATLMLDVGVIFSGSGSISGDLRLIDGLDDGVLVGQGVADGNYLPTSPSVDYRPSLRTLLRDWRHVSENGADPTKPDNYSSIYAANAEACARGQKLIWGKGTYNCASQPFWLTNQSRWIGQGRGLTTLRIANGGGHAVIGMLNRTRLSNRDILVEGFTVDGNGQDAANMGLQAFQLEETVNATIRDIDFINIAANAFNAASGGNQPSAPYTFAPDFNNAGAPTLTGTTTTGSNLINGVSFGPQMPVVGAMAHGFGIPTGATITGVYSSQISISANATASGTVTIAFGPVYSLCSPPDGGDFPTNMELIVERIKVTGIGTFGSPGANADMFVIYGVDGGYCADVELYGGGGNQFSLGFASNFSLDRSEHHDWWQSALYVETSLGLVINNMRLYSPATRPIHPGLQSAPPIGLRLTTAEMTYTTGVGNGAPFAGGRGITVNDLRANGISNGFNNKGPIVVQLATRSGLPSKGITFNSPVIENISCTGGSSPDGSGATPTTAFDFNGHHVGTRIWGGRIANVPRFLSASGSIFDGAQRMIDCTVDGTYLETISDLAITQDGGNHSGLRLANITLGSGVNSAISQTNGAASQPNRVSYGHIGTDAGGNALPSAVGL